jgi:hypothetical protein
VGGLVREPWFEAKRIKARASGTGKVREFASGHELWIALVDFGFEPLEAFGHSLDLFLAAGEEFIAQRC